MQDVRIRKLADLIVKYSVEVKKGEEVLIISTFEALPLVRELYRAILEAGGYPMTRFYDETLDEVFFKYANEEQLKHVSAIEKYIQEKINVRISILSSTHTKHLSSIDPNKIKIRRAAQRELTEIFMRRSASGELKWVVVPYPTKALAQEAGLSYIDFEDFVYRACKIYEEDPVAAWKKQGKEQEKLIELLSKVSEIRIVDEKTDLTLRVDGRTWINDDGHKNMPGGEIFTAPIEDSVEGYITFTYPAVWRGIEVEGVRLKFKKGKVIEALATKGEEHLKKILETDEGAKHVGEFAFGLNYDINRFTKIILFDEKIGGTLHLALGAAYPETGGKNKSAIHWDMIKDLRKAKVYGDGDLILENGRFIITQFSSFS